ncbi:MAG: HAMP domain-containing protein [Nitrospirae bacterium]|nr:HAMP domain-containing protein [Nitrospirota bacterium]
MKTTRASLTYILVSMIAVVVLLSSFYQYWTHKKVTIEWAKDKAIAEIRLLSNDVDTMLNGITKDLFILRDHLQFVSGVIDDSVGNNEQGHKDVETFFSIFAKNRKIYDQIRFINNRGKEVVRINYGDDASEAVKRKSLQDKSRRYYFREAIMLDFGDIYVSPLDLNVEYEIIDRPIKPMIRYATVVINKRGEKAGIVILNVKADHILNIIREHQGHARYSEKYYLTNNDGYYLLHPDNSREWGFMFDKDYRLKNDEPKLSAVFDNNTNGFSVFYNETLKKSSFYAYQRIYPIPGMSVYKLGTGGAIGRGVPGEQFIQAGAVKDIYWVLFSSADVDSLSPVFGGYQAKELLLFSGMLLGSSIIVASLLAWRYSRPVQRLANAATKIADGDLSARVSVSSENEIGRLGAVFNKMAEALESRRQQEASFQQRIREEIVLAQERERRVIAQDIHDHIGHNLAIARMKIQEAVAGLPEDLRNLKIPLDDSSVLLKDMIQQARTLIFDLYPIMLDDFGLLKTVESHVDEFSSRSGLKIKFMKEGLPGEPSRSVSIYMLRVVKELLNNVMKHASAKEVTVTIYGSEMVFGVIVADDGIGFDASNVFSSPDEFRGIGLYSIREWTTGLGGKFSAESSSGKGARIVVEIPLESPMKEGLHES